MNLARLFPGLVLAAALAIFPVVDAYAVGPTGADYRMVPGDRLEISVWKEADLQKAVTVMPDGKLSFPLIGLVDAAGKTLNELRSEVEKKLTAFIPEPVVTVSVTEQAGRVYVIGQVARSGAYPINPRINVLQALALAGGLTPFAKGGDILVLRAGASGQQSISFKFNQVSEGRGLEQNISLESGDVIIVP